MGERAGNTIAASELGPVHGHDPQVDKLAAVPHVSPPPVRERRAGNCCLLTGHTYSASLPSLKKQRRLTI